MIQKSHTHRRKEQSRGFSLVEVLVYLGVTILVATAGVSTFLSLNTVLVRNATERALTHEASVALERIVRDVRAAESVNTGLSSLGTTMGTLVLASSATTTEFSPLGGHLMLTVDGSSVGQLTSDAVTLDDVIFTRYQNSETELVRVALTLSVSNKAASSTRTFYASAVLRGSYE